MTKSITICALVVGLIGLFTAVARGQQAGMAGVGVHSLSEGSLLIGILTWQHSFAGEHSRPDAQVVTFQPIAALSVGHGYYVRSSSIWAVDIADSKNLIPHSKA